jgi:hypothetical protein
MMRRDNQAVGCQISEGMYTASMVRLFTFVFCSLTIPILLVWSYSLWNKGSRRELPRWRNGIGLASINFIFAIWSIQVVSLILFLSRVSWLGFQNFEWYLDHIAINLFPLVLLFAAVAFKGLPRLLVFTAGILVWVLTASLVVG